MISILARDTKVSGFVGCKCQWHPYRYNGRATTRSISTFHHDNLRIQLSVENQEHLHPLDTTPLEVSSDPDKDPICLSCQALLTSIQQQQQQQQINPDESILASTEAYRVFHGRGGFYGPDCEQFTLDWFPPVWVLTSFQPEPLSSKELATIDHALECKWDDEMAKFQSSNLEDPPPSFAWVYQNRYRNNVTNSIMRGPIPENHIVTENGAQYWVQTTADSDGAKGQRHRGIFLDMANGRKWLQENAEGKIILNLFAYTCAFSVAALLGGADEVINIDKVQGALKIGQRNHELNGFGAAGRARFLNHDIFKTWGKLRKLGPYDIIVVDPPSYQKGSFVAKTDYIKLVRRLPDMLVPTDEQVGGSRSQVLFCLNAPELGVDFLKQQVSEGAPELRFVKQVENPSSFPGKDPEKALKVLLYELADD